MHKVFFRNLAFLIGVNLIIKPLWIFGIDRTVQNVVGAQSYGLYFVLMNLSFLTQIFLDFGISNYNNRLIAQQEHLLSEQLSHIFSIKLLLSGIYLLITLFFARLLHYSGHQLNLLLFICGNQILASLIVYVRSNISAVHHFMVDSMFSIMDKALMLIICGLLLFIPVLKSQFIIDWFVYAQLLAYSITLITAIIYLITISGKIEIRLSFFFSIALLKKSFPFALLIALMMIYGKLDVVMIENLLPVDGQREAGFYASAFRLLDALNQFGYLYAVLLLPIFARMLSKNHSVETLVRISFTTIFIIAVIAAVGLSFYSSQIMHLLYYEDPQYSSLLLHYLIYCLIGTCTVYIFGTLLTANGNLYLLSGVSAIAVAVNFLLNFFLIPRLKALGAAESATFTQLLIAVLTVLAAVRIFKWRVNSSLLTRLMVFAIATACIFWLSREIPVSWIFASLAAGAISIGAAFAIGLINVRSILILIRSS